MSLVFVLGFRLTCYYYRKAYYRAFWRSPVACAVREPHASYSGETRFPLLGQNLHRYFWYAAVLVAILLSYDVTQAFRGPDGNFGFGIGSLICWPTRSCCGATRWAATRAGTSPPGG